jgi:hypothetical protein
MTGTAAADTFTASLGRLQSDDALDGAGGADVLNARLGATVTPSIANIETLNIEATSTASLDGANITGANNVNVTGGATLTYLAHAGESFSVAGAGTGLTTTLTKDGVADAITVTLNAGKLGTLTLGSSGGADATADYETINLVQAGATSATLDAANSGTFVAADKKIVVTGAGALELTVAGADLAWNTTTGSAGKAVIDGTGLNGALTLNVGAAGAEFLDVEKMTGVAGFKASTVDSF